MSDLALLVVAVSLFVGGHELLSHPLRAPLAKAIGEKGFLGVYALVALGSLFWAVEIWKAVPPERLWEMPGWAYGVAMAVMLLAFVLFVGSMTTPNPALMGGGMPGATGIRGVQGITRHPMMWAFALWALVHMAMSADPRTLVLAGGVLVLALFGSAMQDRKKMLASPAYATHVAHTSYLPFARQFSGRAPWSSAWPGPVALVGGAVLWGAMLWAHPILIGVQPWRG
ncbi:NnrU family protein [Polymorphobacter sp.]|uniref:NnrU family protein n=1 Tax=Polymorphobacter sp. TaxID=1909290 RepID=UPI003F724AE2